MQENYIVKKPKKPKVKPKANQPALQVKGSTQRAKPKKPKADSY